MTSAEVAGRGPERVEAFSDGVFAIAITLLVLEIRVPSAEELRSPSAILDALGALWPSYLGYLVSFVTIGNVWINHHNLFRLVGSVSHGLLLANLLLLLGVGFMPFPTALLAQTLGGPGQQIGLVVYAVLFLLIAVSFNALWFAAKRVLKPDAPLASVEAINQSYRLGPVISALAVVIALVNPVLGMAVIVGIVLLFLLPRSSGT